LISAVLMVIVSCALVNAAEAPRSHAGRTWSLHAGGGVAFAGSEWTGSSTFTEFAEPALVETRRTPASGGSFEAGLWHGMTPRFGIALTVTRATRDEAGEFTASLPHPLFVDRPRTATGALPSASTKETAIHFGLAWSATRGGFTARLSGGPSYFLAEAELVERIEYTHEYPYDTVNVTGVQGSMVRGDAVGGHADLTLERRISGRVAIAGGARWSRASIQLARSEGGIDRSAKVTAGGITASGSIRLYF
jgi:hypothetical protein